MENIQTNCWWCWKKIHFGEIFRKHSCKSLLSYMLENSWVFISYLPTANTLYYERKYVLFMSYGIGTQVDSCLNSIIQFMRLTFVLCYRCSERSVYILSTTIISKGRDKRLQPKLKITTLNLDKRYNLLQDCSIWMCRFTCNWVYVLFCAM